MLQGLALWQSLQRHDTNAILWVLALDPDTATGLLSLNDPKLQVVELAALEAEDTELAKVKPDRSRAEYYFTISPCWPAWLLSQHPEIDSLTFLDADLMFFSDPAPVFDAMAQSGASVLITSHRFPPWLKHYERHGRFNVGIEVFKNDSASRAVLADWRARCLEWCYDRLDGERYADQKYLDKWPEQFGNAVHVLTHPGVNLAPWNWSNHVISISESGQVRSDEQPLVVFHFARFRSIKGTRWWQSGQLDYGVMPWGPRQAIYGAYWRELCSARARFVQAGFVPRSAKGSNRLDRSFWRGIPVRILFGTDWLRIGDHFISGRAGLGCFSGRLLNLLRKFRR